MDSQNHIIVPLKLSQEEYETIENLAACNFSPKQVAIYLSADVNEFLYQYHKKTSLVRESYDRGVLQSQFDIDNSLLNNARSGNITSAQEFKKAQSKRAFENHKNRILNEG